MCYKNWGSEGMVPKKDHVHESSRFVYLISNVRDPILPRLEVLPTIIV